MTYTTSSLGLAKIINWKSIDPLLQENLEKDLLMGVKIKRKT
jgi:hypothetical protein